MNGSKTFESLTAQSAWALDRIKDHASKMGSGVTPTGGATSYLDSGIPLLRSQNVHFNGLRLDDVAYISEETHDEMSNTKLCVGDVLVNITGASIGRCTFVPEDFNEGNVNQHVSIIRTTSKLNFRYLNYCLAAPWGQDQIFSSFTGASRQGLGRRDLGEIRIPLPLKIEQERIAAYLDASCAAIDRTIAIKRHQLEALATTRDSIIESAVTNGIHSRVTTKPIYEDWINDIPAHWSVCRIKRILTSADYGISQSTGPDGNHPVLKMGNIQQGEILLNNLDFVDDVSDNLLLETGDLLYNRTNSPDQVGKAAIFRGNRTDAITFASYLVRLRTNHLATPYFLNYLLNCNGFLTFARKLAIPSVQQSNLNSTRYCRILIPLPPLEEQREIVSYLDEKITESKRVISVIKSQVELLIAYRKSLIHECVTGKRRISDDDLNRVKAHVAT